MKRFSQGKQRTVPNSSLKKDTYLQSSTWLVRTTKSECSMHDKDVGRKD